MNQKEFLTVVAEMSGTTAVQAKNTFDAMKQVIAAELKDGQDISFTGFGSFKISHRKARTGRNPKTNESIQIPASKVPVFKAGKALKDAVK